MDLGFQVAVRSVPFLDLLDSEEDALAARVAEATDPTVVAAEMESSRRRLAQGVDAFVRSLPAAVRNDLTASRAVAYALVGLADGRMLNHPAGGLDRWRERLLEFELYGSALAGQEVVARARAAAQGAPDAGDTLSDSTLAPFYLGVFRAGFEGSLRADHVGLAALITALEEAVGAFGEMPIEVPPDTRPKRFGLAPLPMALLGLGVWLLSGFAFWYALSGESLTEAERMAERIEGGRPATSIREPLDRSVGPSGLTPIDDDTAGAAAQDGP